MARGQDTGNHPGRKVNRDVFTGLPIPQVGGEGSLALPAPSNPTLGNGQTSRPVGLSNNAPNPRGVSRPKGHR